MDLEGSISGVAEIQKVFRNLPRSTQNKAMRPALRAGGQVVRAAAEENIRAVVQGESTGIGEKNIRVYSLKKKNGNLRVSVQVKKGAVNPFKTDKNGPVRVATYLAVLEYRPGKSWIRKAAREKADAALEVIASEAEKRMVLAVEDAKK